MEATAAVGQLDQVKRVQRVVRIINMICAGTGVGLIVTFLIMNLQLILGNGIGIPFVPKLEGPELIILMVLDLLIVLAIIVFLGAFITIIGSFGGDAGSSTVNKAGGLTGVGTQTNHTPPAEHIFFK